jgi:predicted metal-dependent peptidase
MTKNGLTTTQQKRLLLQKVKPKIKATGLMKHKQYSQLVKGKRQANYSNMYWLLDTSGSMAGDKIWQLIDTVEYLLPKYPLVHMATFESYVTRVPEDRIPHLTAGGSTHMLEALELAWSCNADAIVLVTDGDPTDAPKGLILEEAQARSGIPISTIGIGENHDREFLQALSDATGGNAVQCASDELELLTDKFEEAILLTDDHGKKSGGGAIQL